MKRGVVRAFVLICAVLALAAASKGQVPTGSINGRASDTQGAIVTGAKVTATDEATGVPRETFTNADGLYTLSSIPAADYDIRIEMTGFAPGVFKSVIVEAGRATTVDVTLHVASVSGTIDVSASASEVEVTQSMIQGDINSQTINDLPLNGRNFLELAYLLPGNRPAPNFDPTKTNTLEVSSAGGFGRGGNITVDGGDNNDEVVGGTLSNFPEDSVQEFQIATGRFTAEVGRSGNSIINIVTKSGTNQFHGSVFHYERNRHLQALPATFSPGQPVPPFDREQFGGSAGGPIEKEKAFLFGSVEYRNQNAAIQVGQRDFETQAILNTFAPSPLRDALVSTRFDYELNSHNSLMVRYSFNRSTDVAQASAASPTPLSTAAERQNSLNRFNSLVLGWTSTLSSTKVNSAIFHFDTFLNFIPQFPNDDPTTDPPLGLTNELLFPGLADGVNFNVPQATHLNRFEFRDNFAWTTGKHTIHFGGEYQHYNAFGEINPFGSGSVILVSNFGFADLNGDGVINDLDIPIATAIQSNAPVQPVPIPHIPQSYFALFTQDDWRITPKLTLNLGLRWEYDANATGTGDGDGPCPNLTSVPTAPCEWVANVIDIAHSPDKKDFGPRVGFAYDPFGHGNTVIRGGYGVYYDRIILEVPGYPLVQNDRALTINQYSGSECTFSGDPFSPSLNACFAPGAVFIPGTPTLADPFSGERTTGGAGIIIDNQSTHHPLFQQFSLGVQQQLGRDWLVTADGLHVFGQRQLMAQLLRNTTSTSPYIDCPGNNVPCTITDPLNGVSDQVTVASSAAHSWYDGLLMSVQHKPVKVGPITYFFNASYTLSKTLDYSDDDQIPSYTTVENVNLIEGTVGPQTEKGYAASDEKSIFTFYGQMDMPYGFSLAPLFTYGSGVPADTNIASLQARLPILARNSLGRSVKNSDELNQLIDKWNSLPSCPAPAPCNAGGPLEPVPGGISFYSPFHSLDLRLTKDFRFGERMRLSFIAESFNLFNNVNVRGFSNANYSGRNIALNPVGADPSGVDATFFQPQSVAGGFFGSGGPRAFQFALRFAF
jgi:carboxypeptidase family protein/TonB-dependent receptor-like protein